MYLSIFDGSIERPVNALSSTRDGSRRVTTYLRSCTTSVRRESCPFYPSLSVSHRSHTLLRLSRCIRCCGRGGEGKYQNKGLSISLTSGYLFRSALEAAIRTRDLLLRSLLTESLDYPRGQERGCPRDPFSRHTVDSPRTQRVVCSSTFT